MEKRYQHYFTFGGRGKIQEVFYILWGNRYQPHFKLAVTPIYTLDSDSDKQHARYKYYCPLHSIPS
jgi:hypothetical protein